MTAHLSLCSALSNKLLPCAWLSSLALEVRRLQNYDFDCNYKFLTICLKTFKKCSHSLSWQLSLLACYLLRYFLLFHWVISVRSGWLFCLQICAVWSCGRSSSVSVASCDWKQRNPRKSEERKTFIAHRGEKTTVRLTVVLQAATTKRASEYCSYFYTFSRKGQQVK